MGGTTVGLVRREESVSHVIWPDRESWLKFENGSGGSGGLWIMQELSVSNSPDQGNQSRPLSFICVFLSGAHLGLSSSPTTDSELGENTYQTVLLYNTY
jgi:hypothetical protein